jgi:hypothetical protein
MTSHLLHRAALRGAADVLNTVSGPRREEVLARISTGFTEETASRYANSPGITHAGAAPGRMSLEQE